MFYCRLDFWNKYHRKQIAVKLVACPIRPVFRLRPQNRIGYENVNAKKPKLFTARSTLLTKLLHLDLKIFRQILMD